MTSWFGEKAPGAARGGLTFTQWVGLLIGLHLLLGLALFEPTLFSGGDNARYMILGESLRTGAGYRDLFRPGMPIHVKYPPGYPLLLAGLGWVGGVQLFKLASLILTAAAVGLTAALGRRLVGERPALAAAALLAINPVLLEYSHYVLSEAFFLFLVLLALLGSEGGSNRRYAAGLAAAAGAFLTRTAGLPLLAALPLAAGLDGRYRRMAAGAGVAGVVMAGWALFQRLGPPDQAGYLHQLVLLNPYDPGAGTVGVADLLRRGALNSWTYLGRVLPGSLGVGEGGMGRAWAVPAGIGLGGFALAGWVRRSLVGPGPAEVFTLLYLGLIATWPPVWTDRRFLLPVLPLLVIYVVHGWVGTARSLRGWPRGATAALLVLVSLPSVRSIVVKWPDRLRCVASYRAGAPCQSPALSSFFEAARWAQGHTPADAVVASRKPGFFYLFSGRRGELYTYAAEPSLVLRGLEAMGADYVVVDQLSATTSRYLIPAINEYRDRFVVVYRGGDPPTLILRFTPLPATALVPAFPGR